MEVIKELPEIFEEFAEQRKKSFLTVKEFKERGVPVIGTFCTYFPVELADAMGAATVSLCASSDETIPEAEKDLPKNLCPLIKSSYGFGKSDKCPFFHFSDLVVGETTCDGKKKAYEYMTEFKDVHVMQLPNSQTEDGVGLWKKEIVRMKEYLEEKFGCEITEDAIRQAIRDENGVRRALKGLYNLMKNDPLPMAGMDLYNVLNGSTFRLDRQEMRKSVEALTRKVEEEYAAGKHIEGNPKRILITGCPIGGVAEKVIGILESNGAAVVTLENCGGAKSLDLLVDESNPDVYDALARRYLSIGCSVMSPNPNRKKLLGELIDDFHVDGVVEVVLQACHTYNVESRSIGRYVTEEKHIPHIAVETDYSQADKGQLTTRLTAFVEMLG